MNEHRPSAQGTFKQIILVDKSATYKDSSPTAAFNHRAVFKQILRVITYCLRRCHSLVPGFCRSLSPKKKPPQREAATAAQRQSPLRGKSQGASTKLPAPQAADSITYTLPRSEVVSALNRTLKQKASHASQSGNRHLGNAFPSEDEQLSTIESLADSAYVCECQGRLTAAERHYQLALTLSSQHFGKMHLEVAPHLSNLARFYYAQQRYIEALPLLEQTLSIVQQQPHAPHTNISHTSHIDVGELCYQLADIYRYHGNYARAESLFQQALSTLKQTHGPNSARSQAVHSELMKMLTAVIESGQFKTLAADSPPLDLSTLGETYSWATPHWMKPSQPNQNSADDYSWVKLHTPSEDEQT